MTDFTPLWAAAEQCLGARWSLSDSKWDVLDTNGRSLTRDYGFIVMTEAQFVALANPATILALRCVITRYEAALQRIAKPALGGKQQQWIAQASLREAEDVSHET